MFHHCYIEVFSVLLTDNIIIMMLSVITHAESFTPNKQSCTASLDLSAQHSKDLKFSQQPAYSTAMHACSCLAPTP